MRRYRFISKRRPVVLTEICGRPIRMGLVMNRPLRLTIAIAAMGLLASACTGPQAGAPTKTDLLAQAGFVRKDANTEERLAALKMLPPHQFVLRNSNGSVKYMYADPTVCACIYVGGQRDYDRYRQMMAARVSQDQLRAILSNAPLPAGAGLSGGSFSR
jgi:hypothetical protein